MPSTACLPRRTTVEACRRAAPGRVAALRSTGLLAERHVAGWDRLTRLAAHVAHGMALICLADEDDLVVMSASSPSGRSVPVDRFPLSRSLARHVIGGDLPLVVDDARVDHRLHPADRSAAFGIVAFAGFPLRTADGTVLGCLSVLSDRPVRWEEPVLAALADLAATAEVEFALRMQNRALEEKAALTRTVMTAMSGTAALLVDARGRVRMFGPGAEKVLGYTAADVVDRMTLGALLPEEERADPSAWLARAAGEQAGEHHLRRADGTAVPVVVVVTRFVDSGGAPAYFVAATDVTERRRGERLRREALAQQVEAVRRLEELDRAKSLFVSNTSHELRTPVTSILGYTAMLSSGAFGELTPRQAAALDRVTRNTERLRRLLEDLLSLSQVEAGRLEVRPGPVDLADLAVRGCAAVRPTLEGREVALEIDVPPATVHVDDEAMERVLANLLDNAVKYTPDGGTVRLSARVGPDATVVEVADTGVGIPEEEQPGLFTRFHRGAAGRDLALEGTGLGLALSRAIVEAHHGTIRVHSRSGEGTNVTVTLPHGG